MYITWSLSWLLLFERYNIYVLQKKSKNLFMFALVLCICVFGEILQYIIDENVKLEFFYQVTCSISRKALRAQ